jgi:formylglycine-generating enzyme required for sulfatase activity
MTPPNLVALRGTPATQTTRVWDRYDPYPASIPLRYSRPENGDLRLLRGGSFQDTVKPRRATNRTADYPTRVARYRGLRVAMDLR